MKVLIVGAGSVGASIAKELKANGHTVTIIDSKPEMKKTYRPAGGALAYW